jgi:methyl-accepting chemotaxis protein
LGHRFLLSGDFIRFRSLHNFVNASFPPSNFIGQVLSSSQIELGAPLQVNDSLVGMLLVTPGEPAGQDSPAAQFLASVNRSILLVVAITGSLALVLGALLFFQITSPLRWLDQAVRAIQQGDLGQRVEVKSQDKLGQARLEPPAGLSTAWQTAWNTLRRSASGRRRRLADVSRELRPPPSLSSRPTWKPCWTASCPWIANRWR